MIYYIKLIFIEKNKNKKVLVFTKGLDDIDELTKRFSKLIDSNNYYRKEYIALPLHGKLSASE